MKKGFSLVELSIVIIIIGLLFVGVSAGSSLIQQAKLKSIINEIMEVQRSVRIFKVAYDYLPGDFPGAGVIWGDACGGNTPAGNGCNGDGDGVVGVYGGGNFRGSTYQTSQVEFYRFWQHMQLADVIGGSYTGVHAYTTAETNWNSVDNVYESKVFPSILFLLDDVRRWRERQSDQVFWIMNNKEDFWKNDPQSSLSTVQTHNIDKKIDDGLPLSGFMFSRDVWNDGPVPGCYKIVNSVAVYTLDDSTKKCRSFIYTKNLW